MKKIYISIFVVLLLISCGGNTNKRGDLVLKTVTEDCPDCNDGFGYFCGDCGGVGVLYSSCSYCNGTGSRWSRRATLESQTCSVCGGSGRVRGPGNGPCNFCCGSGSSICMHCLGKGTRDLDFGTKLECTICDGTGYLECSKCGGRGYIQGPEYETCGFCLGSGFYGAKPVVQMEYEQCQYCHGTLQIKTYCRTCGGDGYIYIGGSSGCSTCNGTGKITVEKWVEE